MAELLPWQVSISGPGIDMSVVVRDLDDVALIDTVLKKIRASLAKTGPAPAGSPVTTGQLDTPGVPKPGDLDYEGSQNTSFENQS